MRSADHWISVPEGGELAATLTLPDAADRPACVVLGHGFGLPREAGLDPLVVALADAGVAALRFDHRHINAGRGEPRGLINAPVQREDWRAALAWTRARPDLDSDHVGIWGFSFGGGRALEIAAEDGGLGAIVARCPASNAAITLAGFGTRRLLAMLGAARRDRRAGRRGQPPLTAPIADADHPASIFHGVYEAERYLGLIPPGHEFENAYAPRLLLRTEHLFPGRRARSIACPLLVVVGGADEVTPPGPSVKVAHKAPHGELVRYRGDHFATFEAPEQDRIVAAEAAFLVHHLNPSRPEAPLRRRLRARD